MRLRYAPFYGLLLCLLTACTTLNVPAPTTWNQRVLAAYNSVDAAVQSVQTLAIAGKISKADAQSAHDRAVQLMDAIRLADELHGTNPTEGEDALAASIKTLQALQAELQKRQS